MTTNGVWIILAAVCIPLFFYLTWESGLSSVGELGMFDIGVGKTRQCPSCDQQITQENWLPPDTVPDYIQTLDQTDPALAQYISRYWLLPPSTLPRNLETPNKTHYSQSRQSENADQYLKGRKNGFFVECGAHDGERLSNSLFFEKTRNWSGVLVEPGDAFKRLRQKHRHSYLLNICLSPVGKAIRIPFRMAGVLGGLNEYLTDRRLKIINHATNTSKTVIVQCFPIFSILQAIGIKHVDFFSLDIESGEAEVIETLPFDQLTVDIFTIEYGYDEDKLRRIKEILVIKHGYTVIREDGQDITLKRKNFIA